MEDEAIGTTVRVQRWLDRLSQDDPRAQEELLHHSSRRFRALVAVMIRDFPRLMRWEEVDDVCQLAMLRLWRSLDEVRPTTVDHFFRLAAVQIRRELCDLARRYQGPRGEAELPGNSHGHDLQSHVFDTTHIPDKLMFWTDFHAAVERLPEPEKTVFDMIWYHNVAQTEIAEIMNITPRHVRRCWTSARVRMREYLAVHFPV